MAKKKRPSYDDKFRASAVIMLQAAGYPETKGALASVSTHLKVPARTLSRWARGENNPPPDIIVSEKRSSLIDLLNNELDAIFVQMDSAREDASYRDLGTVAGILMDKRQLLTGQPTAIWKQQLADAGIDVTEEYRSLVAKYTEQLERND